MNKQLVQEIINADNKAMDSVPVKYTVDSKYIIVIMVIMDFIMMIIM